MARSVVAPFDPGESSHGISGGGFDPVVGAAAAAEEVVAGPGDVVPGDDAEQFAVAEILAGLFVGRGMAKLGLRLVSLKQWSDHQ